jgi:uncharacterized protein (DUF169 family)
VTRWRELGKRLSTALEARTDPVAIAFADEVPKSIERYGTARPDDNQSGGVPAGCVFWNEALSGNFATVAEDHANCSVGSYTHGFLDAADTASADDVATLLEAGWVTVQDLETAPRLPTASGTVLYGPLAEVSFEPDVILFRLEPEQMMVVADAVPELDLTGKPQCRIVPAAHEEGRISASLGCAVSRVRTGMAASEMTCAIPAGRFGAVVEAVEDAAGRSGCRSVRPCRARRLARRAIGRRQRSWGSCLSAARARRPSRTGRVTRRGAREANSPRSRVVEDAAIESIVAWRRSGLGERQYVRMLAVSSLLLGVHQATMAALSLAFGFVGWRLAPAGQTDVAWNRAR